MSHSFQKWLYYKVIPRPIFVCERFIATWSGMKYNQQGHVSSIFAHYCTTCNSQPKHSNWRFRIIRRKCRVSVFLQSSWFDVMRESLTVAISMSLCRSVVNYGWSVVEFSFEWHGSEADFRDLKLYWISIFILGPDLNYLVANKFFVLFCSYCIVSLVYRFCCPPGLIFSFIVLFSFCLGNAVHKRCKEAVPVAWDTPSCMTCSKDNAW